MKNLFMLVLCLLLGMQYAYAERIYEYHNSQPINDVNSIKCNGCSEYVSIPAKHKFSPLSGIIGASVAGAAVLPLIMDPYVVKIDGVNYVLVKDRNDQNWSEKDLLGINDPKGNRFESLIKLNSDRDYSKVTSEELKKAKIRFVRMNSKGVLLVNERNKDYDLNKIDYIDIINLKRTANSENTGVFGHFTVYLKTANAKKRAVVGYVTYETEKKIEILFK